MYEYTAVYMLAADGAVFDTYQKKNHSHFQSGDVSHATTVGYDVLQSESRLLLCCAPVSRVTPPTCNHHLQQYVGEMETRFKKGD